MGHMVKSMEMQGVNLEKTNIPNMNFFLFENNTTARIHYSICYPVSTRRCFDVHLTSITFKKRQIYKQGSVCFLRPLPIYFKQKMVNIGSLGSWPYIIDSNSFFCLDFGIYIKLHNNEVDDFTQNYIYYLCIKIQKNTRSLIDFNHL